MTDLFVGADGRWSRVRPLLTSWKPEYTGLTVIDCRISNLDKKYPELGRFVGRGLTLIGDSLHAMSWFAGEGANLAMLDALDLFHEVHAISDDSPRAYVEGMTRAMDNWFAEGKLLKGMNRDTLFGD